MVVVALAGRRGDGYVVKRWDARMGFKTTSIRSKLQTGLIGESNSHSQQETRTRAFNPIYKHILSYELLLSPIQPTIMGNCQSRAGGCGQGYAHTSNNYATGPYQQPQRVSCCQRKRERRAERRLARAEARAARMAAGYGGGCCGKKRMYAPQTPVIGEAHYAQPARFENIGGQHPSQERGFVDVATVAKPDGEQPPAYKDVV